MFRPDADDEPTITVGIAVETPTGPEVVSLDYDDTPTVVYPVGFIELARYAAFS